MFLSLHSAGSNAELNAFLPRVSGYSLRVLRYQQLSTASSHLHFCTISGKVGQDSPGRFSEAPQQFTRVI